MYFGPGVGLGGRVVKVENNRSASDAQFAFTTVLESSVLVVHISYLDDHSVLCV